MLTPPGAAARPGSVDGYSFLYGLARISSNSTGMFRFDPSFLILLSVFPNRCASRVVWGGVTAITDEVDLQGSWPHPLFI